MTFLDWWLAGCATLAGGAAGYCWRHAHRAYDQLDWVNDDLDRLAWSMKDATTDAVEWRVAHAELDARITHAHTVATALGQTDIVTILNGDTA